MAGSPAFDHEIVKLTEDEEIGWVVLSVVESLIESLLAARIS